MAASEKTRGTRTRLPGRLRPLFWDYPFGELRWTKDRDLITARVLAVGDWDAVQWLRRRLGDDGLCQWLERRRGAGLSGAHLRFWN
jgi:hypothetical protein